MERERPKLSVIAIARHDAEVEDLKRALKTQSFTDFEFVYSTRGTIPQAWNDAVSRARGEFLVFMESDAAPLNENWLSEIARVARKGAVLKGLEVRPFDLDMSNLICDAEIFANRRFDESFKTVEDSELFARLRTQGVEIEFVETIPIVHSPTRTWHKTLSRAFGNGVSYSRLVYMYGIQNIDTVNTQFRTMNRINPISNRLRIIVENILLLLGLAIGAVAYLPSFIVHRRSRKR